MTLKATIGLEFDQEWSYQREIELEVPQILERLQINSTRAALLFPKERLVLGVQEILRQQPSAYLVKPGNLIYNIISSLLYEHCAGQEEAKREEAYQWLFEYLYRWFYGKLNRNQDLAQDLASDVVMTVIKDLETVRSYSHFITWIRTIAVNRLNSYFRKTHTEKKAGFVFYPPLMPTGNAAEVNEPQHHNSGPTLSSSTSYQENIACLKDLPEEIILKAELKERLIKAIAGINTNTKRAFNYKKLLIGTYFDGKSTPELAIELNIPQSEVYKQRHQALIQLRKKLIELENVY